MPSIKSAHRIEHRLIRPRRPQSVAPEERSCHRITGILQETAFATAEQLERTLRNDCQAYNHHIPQKALGHVAPVDALVKWQNSNHELFVRPIQNLTGLGTEAQENHLIPSLSGGSI